MQATLSLPVTRRTPLSQPVMVDSAATSQEVSLDSEALLRGKKSVAIIHNGSTYRLQATKLGKLILTK
ncbi:hemin uptake protein HemP [Comamonas sp. NoAH]|uniref:hemin uptake protein HemP n=1 Tax=Comamonas halotolerans TaxID=3041496 RepID=UPI0024E0B4A8|nr:hemin uptake protein HemP [Comamonas sp. NoAH]